MTNEEKIEIGQQAKEFMIYIDNNPYFKEMIDRVKVNLMARMCQLRPSQTEEFKTISEQFHFCSTIVEVPLGEALEGEEAYMSLTGIKSNVGGIL